MKTATFFTCTMCFLFAFIGIHIASIFYIANLTEDENDKNVPMHATVQINESNFNNYQVDSRPLAIK